MAMWEQIMLGIVAFAIFFFFWPGAKKAIEQSKQAENPDWMGALVPIGVVIVFVVLLIAMAKS